MNEPLVLKDDVNCKLSSFKYKSQPNLSLSLDAFTIGVFLIFP